MSTQAEIDRACDDLAAGRGGPGACALKLRCRGLQNTAHQRNPAEVTGMSAVGVNQTSISGRWMSAFSQEQTFDGIMDVPDRGIGWLRKERRSPGNGANGQFHRV